MFQFYIYGCFWHFIGTVFLVIFATQIMRSGGIASVKRRFETEGIWVRKSESHEAEDERRDVPLGTTEAQ